MRAPIGKPIIKGTLEPVRVSEQINFDPSKGLITSEEWESAGDHLGGMAVTSRLRGDSYSLRANGRKSRISITLNGGTTTGVPDVPLDSWQLLGNEISKDIKESPAAKAIPTAKYTVPGGVFIPGNLTSILQAVKDYEAGEFEAAAVAAYPAASRALFDLLIHGVTSYQVGQYVLRHTTSVSDNYNTNVADLGVERIYSTFQLVSEISNTSYWTKPCPGRLVAKIQNMEINGPNSDGFIWGWRKLPSTETSAANNRIDISTEYVLASWSTFLYSAL